MRLFQRHRHLMFPNIQKIDSEYVEKFRKLNVVDHAETEELVNARRRIRIFDLRQPCVRNMKFFVPLDPRDSFAFFRNFTRCNAKLCADLLQSLARAQMTSPRMDQTQCPRLPGSRQQTTRPPSFELSGLLRAQETIRHGKAKSTAR